MFCHLSRLSGGKHTDLNPTANRANSIQQNATPCAHRVEGVNIWIEDRDIPILNTPTYEPHIMTEWKESHTQPWKNLYCGLANGVPDTNTKYAQQHTS